MAKTISNALNENVATKADVKTLGEMLNDKIDKLEGTLLGKFKELELRMTIKLGAMMFATAFLILAAARFLLF